MTKAKPTLIHHELDVNFWTKNDPGVDAARPSHCCRCDMAAHGAEGRLRLHGHGRRRRDLWGPAELGSRPEIFSVWLRRYRCVECGGLCTVAPRGIATRFRYGVTAIAMALLFWGLWAWTAASTRAAISPNTQVGFCEPGRWRSLRRWSRRAAELFALPEALDGKTARGVAHRVAHVLIARGPPELDQRHRIAVGACAR